MLRPFVFLLLLSPWAAFAEPAEKLVEGQHYFALDVPVKTIEPKRIEVTEYFSYGCIHCYRFDPLLASWVAELPDDVYFNRTPAIFAPSWEIYAQAYYAERALGVLDRTHGLLFDAIHRDHKQFQRPEDLAKLFATVGIDRDDFLHVFNSFGVRSSVQQAKGRGRAYRARGVPTMIVNGRWRVSTGDSSPVRTHQEMLDVVDYLIGVERARLHGTAESE